MVKINAGEVFNVSVDACFFIIQFSPDKRLLDKCNISDINDMNTVFSCFGFVDGKYYSDINKQTSIDGSCCFNWRQGVKHDCSKIMELTKKNNGLYNGYDVKVDIEDRYLYPLLKSSSLKSFIINQSNKKVIVTQKKIGENTDHIKYFPKTWKYLENYRANFDARKSSIYKNSPPYSMFGVGDYSYSKYKVAVSGFYKTPLFSLVYNEKPVMLDDTCYFISFSSYDNAYVAMLILNSDIVQNFLKSISFADSKRPYTKKNLQRIDFKSLVKMLSFDDLFIVENKLNLCKFLTKEMLLAFTNLIDSAHQNMKKVIVA